MITVDEKVINIIKKLPNENAGLDYKVLPYKKEKMADFIIDVIAMLNSDESYGSDKFIIFGITDNKFKKGIIEELWYDDNHFQNLVDKINPRPEILTGNITYEKLIYGFVYISCNNKDRVYEVKFNYISEKSFVSEGQAFIRKGSKNYTINSDEREQAILKIKKNRNSI